MIRGMGVTATATTPACVPSRAGVSVPPASAARSQQTAHTSGRERGAHGCVGLRDEIAKEHEKEVHPVLCGAHLCARS
jgi:hypothetical protein